MKALMAGDDAPQHASSAICAAECGQFPSLHGLGEDAHADELP